MADRDWDKAVELRGKSFMRNLETFKLLTRLKPPKGTISGDREKHARVSLVIFLFQLNEFQNELNVFHAIISKMILPILGYIYVIKCMKFIVILINIQCMLILFV